MLPESIRCKNDELISWLYLVYSNCWIRTKKWSPESFLKTKLAVQRFSIELWFLQIHISNWPCYLQQMIMPCETQPGSKAIQQARLHDRISYAYMHYAAQVIGMAFTRKQSWFHSYHYYQTKITYKMINLEYAPIPILTSIKGAAWIISSLYQKIIIIIINSLGENAIWKLNSTPYSTSVIITL